MAWWRAPARVLIGLSTGAASQLLRNSTMNGARSMVIRASLSRVVRVRMGTSTEAAVSFHEPPTVLHVNRGLGGKEAIRVGAYPQVSRIVLKVS